MTWLLWACVAGLLAGFWLLPRVPLCPETKDDADGLPVSVIVPARNEERNLPRLLDSLQGMKARPAEVIVVDDDSSDATARVAEARGARVVPSGGLAEGWKGKSWACYQGAQAAKGDALLFLDADTWLEPGGYARLMALFAASGPQRAVVSVLPYHRVERAYEQLSVYFHLLMAMGAGGFGLMEKPKLFGQSLLLRRDAYRRSGGHAAIRGEILENFKLAAAAERAGLQCIDRGGRGVLAMRMFPDGFGQLCEGWTKGFAQGAAGSSRWVLGLSVVWLGSAALAFGLLLHPLGADRVWAAALYAAFAAQLILFARQVGNYSVLTGVLYPVPLGFYFGLFGLSLLKKALGRKATWRGRAL
jgi:4,4'-diaponeurosporenoate glycosyltransferase